ncbi:RyR domain-containing protein [Draconibacterium sp. IB214405]|uniref:RyR domain-containing protein n=1 Tax=Draconibacterium sp. IB214405 TaxID=3097352 RepID=UPI002A0EEF31|nr:RyR domain-containing protein [Draconibacterium sp. IB214405]MDX8341754.1 RyR domain-containing protein [Draconibacterium sp. IB214405]
MNKNIAIPDELSLLLEQLAKNVHNTWMTERINQGWRYGHRRNDELKTHPCLIDYEDLSEEEKNYDRNTALQTIQFILNSGYQINKI